MPAPGDQHRVAATATNPFEEIKPRINEYTAQEIATLASRLEKQLGPEYISSRPGASGQRVHYLAADKCINLANEVFGFNGWSSAIQSTQIDYVDESSSSGKISLGLSVIMRVTLRDGTYHEDVGYGQIENCKSKAAAFEKAKKEGTTDALKRALRSFGNILGNCIYDKEYLAKVTKLKIAPSKWDADNLHRHPDFAPIKKESIDEADISRASILASNSSCTEGEDEFGGDELDDADFSVANSEHPDEIALDLSAGSESSRQQGHILKNAQAPTAARPAGATIQQARPPPARIPPAAPPPGPQTPTTARNTNNFNPQGRMAAQQYNINAAHKTHQPPPQHQQLAQPIPPPNHPQRPPMPPPQAQQAPTTLSNPRSAPPSAPQSPTRHLQQQQHQMNNPQTLKSTPPSIDPAAQQEGPDGLDAPLTFVTARAAESIQNNTNPTSLPPTTALFNPHSESPSIRKTAGVDHSKSKAVGRDIIGAPSPSHHSTNLAVGGGITAPARQHPNFTNPQADQNRRIGMPVGAASGGGVPSPLQNRNSYKPPSMVKRPLESPGLGQQGSRTPLGDSTARSVNVPADNGHGTRGGAGAGAGAGSGGDVKRQRVGNANGSGGGSGVG